MSETCTNATVERIFSLENDYWRSKMSQRSVKTLSAVLTVKFIMQNQCCLDVATLLDEHPHLAKKSTSKKNDIFDTSQFDYEGDFDEQITNLLSYIRLSKEEVECLTLLFGDLDVSLQTVWPGCQVLPFGSIITGMGIKTSDVDCYIELPNFVERKQSIVMRAKDILRRYPHIFQNLFAVASAKVPIVKLQHVPTSRHCDINFNSVTGVKNSKLLTYLFQLDGDALKMAIIIKYWSKVHAITGTNLMSSYAMTLLVVFYLQQEKVFPSVFLLQKHVPPEITDHWNTAFDDKTPYIKNNDKPLYDLLGGFFKFYYNFKFSDSVISLFEGTALRKEDFENLDSVSDNYHIYKENVKKNVCKMLRVDSYMCVQDPFELSKNCTVAVYPKLSQRIVDCFKSASIAYEKETSNNFLRLILKKNGEHDPFVKPNPHKSLVHKQKLINKPHLRNNGFNPNIFNKKAVKTHINKMFQVMNHKKTVKS